ncbi:hypothetical protein PM3016_1022 [Paenibacillus mucilaginosus 3016]|uniref:DinB-like domain-containing protein n=2 Tax=Paenibacillus mucilaginosus TaxID=61624 RepID=H6N9F5_9BACL|nr:DinB family protein [Paenibacillus mucilaginosus]AFC27961.1 hypothetical protein PM3016_1022 [Paenibacillus mucilaginosus 3016]AFH60116.1 hypothetical protein B2K_05155 [Paenibacillus mucilaginosus K02]WFA16816.1 DinB family protein [Paenibacillus mucilaginosus]
MTTQAIFHTAKVLRQIAIGQLQGAEEEKFDVQPEGFSNTVRWNAGHMIYFLDKFSTLSFGTPSAVPDSYEAFFTSGTKPSDWTQTPPSKEELLGQLSAQLTRLSEWTPELLERELPSPVTMGPFQFGTAAELFNFGLIHDAIHLGVVKSQLRAIQ